MYEFPLSFNPWFGLYGALIGLFAAFIACSATRVMGFGAMNGTTFIEDFKKPALYFAGIGALAGLVISMVGSIVF